MMKICLEKLTTDKIKREVDLYKNRDKRAIATTLAGFIIIDASSIIKLTMSAWNTMSLGQIKSDLGDYLGVSIRSQDNIYHD